jgi:peroxiredoxin
VLNRELGSEGSKRPLLALAGGVFIGAAVGYLVFFGLPSAPTELQPQSTVGAPQFSIAGLETGSQAPDFELETAEGTTVGLADYRGEVVLLNFWATWCAPCRTEMPLLQSTFESFKDQGFIVLGIDFDESADLVASFGDEFGLTFPLLLDPGGKIQQQYKVRGYPTTVVLDREGRIQAYHIGILTQSQLDGYLESAGLNQ